MSKFLFLIEYNDIVFKGIGVDKLYSDINFREGGFYTLNNIKKEYINLFKEKRINK